MINLGQSIRSKLIAIILLMSAGSLAVGMLGIGVNYYQTSQEALIADAETQAGLLATNAAVPVSLGSKEVLKKVLNSAVLSGQFGAAIFDNTGHIMAVRDEDNTEFYISEAEYKSEKHAIWGGDRLYVWSPILQQQDGEYSGIVYLKISTEKFYSKIQAFTLMSIVIVIALLFLVYLISLRMQRMISGPLVELEDISRKVSGSGNYAIRVPYYGEDEIGSLARSFNQMLETIELNQKERDSANEALQLNKKRLERAVKDLQYLANYDSLTQLPNRALCMDRIKYALKRASRTSTMVSILFLDLDHFKDVNDSLGHAVGDQLLKATSQRLLEKIRSEDTLARLGGDEFVIILNEIRDTEDVITIVEKIVSSFEAPFRLSNYEVNTTVSVGVCMFPNDGADVDSLMKAADAAMYKAKEVGRNTYEFYEAELNQLAIRRHQLANELRQAIKNEELSLVFQPQLNIKANKVIGAEVLLRWHHPILGNISPAEFVPIAENTGLIKEIGAWVLDNACAKIAECQKEGIDIRLAVNLSALQFRQVDLPESIASVMQSHRIPPRLLEVEITESMLMRDVSQAIDILERLKEMQIRIAIDDFGTGYSSLSYLRRFPLDALKIDRSFIDELVVDADDTAITLAIISMAKSLRLEVIAEGVETAQQKEFLAQNNCDDIQGYHFSRPLNYQEFTDFLKKRVDTDCNVNESVS
ncbi:EAL domain-containing protein [Aliikangiella coralliicola]|uniref:cyclic-guanylate-specific phosphodiesterase n=1 Tax=Aliikangiella coralliicola TaxID=2592383 RepID=A0A545UHP9_9GAMM|nr:EAL domain-containing protein [Aliikangiella coralliicola]TQV88992.1 EAL domain-containing protein [Aliikangiella coralliicola]